MKINSTLLIIIILLFFITGADGISPINYPDASLPSENNTQYWLTFEPVPAIQIGHPLIISGSTNAPEGTSFLLTGESIYNRMHSHQKNSDFSHDTFFMRGMVQKQSDDIRNFSTLINTSNLRPDNYIIFISINERSYNQTHIQLLAPEEYWIKLNPIEENIRESRINISGITNLPPNQKLLLILSSKEMGIIDGFSITSENCVEKGQAQENQFLFSIDSRDMKTGDYTAEISGVVYDKVNTTTSFHHSSTGNSTIFIVAIAIFICFIGIFLLFYTKQK